MSLEKVKAYFSGTEFDGKIIEFDMSSATVELAAAALGCDGDMIAKTLSVVCAPLHLTLPFRCIWM